MTNGRFGAGALQAFSSGILQSAGLRDADAAVIAKDLVKADLRGLDSHGIARLPIYVNRIRSGIVNPRPAFRAARTRLL